jgi:hypothetical protein
MQFAPPWVWNSFSCYINFSSAAAKAHCWLMVKRKKIGAHARVQTVILCWNSETVRLINAYNKILVGKSEENDHYGGVKR